MVIEFYEGSIGEDQLLDSVDAKFLPRMGEYVELDIDNFRKMRYEIISVHHIINIRTRNMTIESNIDLIRCGCMRI